MQCDLASGEGPALATRIAAILKVDAGHAFLTAPIFEGAQKAQSVHLVRQGARTSS